MGGMLTAFKEGELPPEIVVTERIKTYELMPIVNPETRERVDYYVNVDDRHLWNELVAVSDGFINSKIQQGIRKFQEEFMYNELPRIRKEGWNEGARAGIDRFKALPWYCRLFNLYPITHKI